LFHDEMQRAQSQGILTDIHCAFSRVKGKQKVRHLYSVIIINATSCLDY